ncbi:hypothetical protein RKD29_006313 [Streptomyces tendae]
MAGGGLAPAALTAGAGGCDEDAVDVEEPGNAAVTSRTVAVAVAVTRRPAPTSTGGGRAPEPLWTKPTSAETYGDNYELVAAGGIVIVSGSPLAALDAATGGHKWSLPGGAVPGAPLLLGQDTLYLASSDYDGSVIGYAPVSGKETWRSRLGKEYRQPRPIAVDGEQVYVIAEILEDDGSSKTNVIAALNSTTGRVAWKDQRDVGTEQNGIHATVRGRHLVYTDFEKNLTVRDTAGGGQVWTHKTTRRTTASSPSTRTWSSSPKGTHSRRSTWPTARRSGPWKHRTGRSSENRRYWRTSSTSPTAPVVPRFLRERVR